MKSENDNNRNNINNQNSWKKRTSEVVMSCVPGSIPHYAAIAFETVTTTVSICSKERHVRKITRVGKIVIYVDHVDRSVARGCELLRTGLACTAAVQQIQPREIYPHVDHQAGHRLHPAA